MANASQTYNINYNLSDTYTMYGPIYNKKITACLFGQKSFLPWGLNEEKASCIKMKSNLRSEIINAIQQGYRIFICGLESGCDLIGAEIVIDLKQKYDNIKLIGALHSKDQVENVHIYESARFNKIMQKLNGIRCIYHYNIGKECLIERNKFMIENSSLMFAISDCKEDYANATIDYAKQNGLKVVAIDLVQL